MNAFPQGLDKAAPQPARAPARGKEEENRAAARGKAGAGRARARVDGVTSPAPARECGDSDRPSARERWSSDWAPASEGPDSGRAPARGGRDSGRAPAREGRDSGRAPARGGARRASKGKHDDAGRGERKGGRAHVSLYDDVTARIVAELEAGRFPWTQPWDAAAFAPGLPRNADTRRSYSGINILILWGEAMRRGFRSQGWLTFRQALAAGGAVRKGEKGTTIFYAARFTPDADKQRGGTSGGGTDGSGVAAGRASGTEGGDGSIPFLKRFTVFNVAQVDGLPDRCTVLDAALAPRQTLPQAERLIAATGADVRIGGNEAYYSPSGDYVALPPQQAFFEAVDYYRTALHELGHWTGHRSRLARDQSGAFGSAAYGREELCAELASAFLCAALGIRPTVRHADYLGAWLAILRADTRAIFKAASHASKAADYLLSFGDGGEAETAPASARGTEAGLGSSADATRGAEAGQ